MELWDDPISKRVFRVFPIRLQEKYEFETVKSACAFFFSTKINTNKLIGQTLLKAPLGLFVEGHSILFI